MRHHHCPRTDPPESFYFELQEALDEAIQALQAQQSVADNLRNKLEGMRFDLSLMAASDSGFDELEARCEAFDEAISIAEQGEG